MPVTLGTIRIHVERAAHPGYPFTLNLKALCISIAMTMNGNRSSNRNDAFLQARPLGTGRWRQGDVPDFAIGAHFHRRMRSGKANTGFHSACEFEFLIGVSGPTVMGRSWKSGKRKDE